MVPALSEDDENAFASTDSAIRDQETVQVAHFERLESDPSFGFAFLTLAVVIGTISVGLLVYQADLTVLMAIAIFEAIVAVMVHWKVSGKLFVTLPASIFWAALKSIWKARVALVIFVLIGALIAAFISAGTVSALIYWGVNIISPAWFLPAGLLLCSLMSIATGTAWGTVGTAGVVLLGVGGAMGIPLPIIAGVIASGACFGDKMSPVSDTTNLAAMSAGTDLYRHIRSMTYTTAPTYLIVLIAYTITGRMFSNRALPEAKLQQLSNALTTTYTISWVALIPLVVLLALSMARVNAITTMGISTVVAFLIGIYYQDSTWGAGLHELWAGGGKSTGIESLDSLLSRGGVVSMWPTMQLSLLALVLGGLLLKFGFMRSVIAGVLSRVRRRGSLISSAIVGAIVGNLGMGEAYMSIILGGQLFQQGFDRAKIDRSVLSRCLEEGATLTTPLIPWTTAGIFFSTTMGVATVEYLPYAWLNLLNPLMGVLFAYMGWGLMKEQKKGLFSVLRARKA